MGAEGTCGGELDLDSRIVRAVIAFFSNLIKLAKRKSSHLISGGSGQEVRYVVPKTVITA